MRKELYKKLCFLSVLLCIPLAMMGQGITVTGTVMDGVMNTGFPGATVTVKDTAIGQVTDLDGNYSITVPSSESVLVFSFLGYADQEVVVGNRTVIDVVLQEDNQTVDEVVVIAYGTQNKGLVTSAISSVNTKDLVKSPAASVTNMLAGSMPGVSAVQMSGQPGADEAQIFVRGNGSLSSTDSAPLILVDGIERDFSQLDPNEIESISVLKDASSTAVFGVRGANGVIIVTTRRGTLGKPTINVSASLGVQQPIQLVQQVGSYEWASFYNQVRDMEGTNPATDRFTREQLEAYRTGSDPIMYPNKNWMKEVFNDVFIQSKNNINISGGTENVKYFVSLGYLYQNGIMKQMPGLSYDNNYNFNRYNYRANVDVKLSPTTQMKIGVGGHVGKTQQPNLSGEGGDSTAEGWTLIMLWSQPWSSPGFIDGVRTMVTAADADMFPSGVGSNRRDGWFALFGGNSAGGYQQQYNTKLNLDVDITQKLDVITKGLSVSVKGAYDNSFTILKNRTGGRPASQFVTYKGFTDGSGLAMTDPDFDKTHLFFTNDGNVPTAMTYGESYGRSQSWYFEGRLNYERTFSNDHRVSALFLYNQSRRYYPTAVQSLRYIPRGYIGIVGRATYSYRNKYMADVNIGYNGSENFAPGKTRYGLFPAFSAGWVVSEEKFMQSQNVVSYLKLRASWGRVGNDNTNSRFIYAASAWTNSGSYSFGSNTANSVPSWGLSRESNPIVTWETADKQNYGLDIKFLDNRLTLTADYFREHRTGILTQPKSQPGIASITWPSMNIGIVNNQGYEISLGWSDSAGKDFSYYINANMSFARNKIIFMDEISYDQKYKMFTGGTVGRYELMYSNQIQGALYKFDRLYQDADFKHNADGSIMVDANGRNVLVDGLATPEANVFPGDAMFADMNGDGLVNDLDRFATGYGTSPEYTFGLNAGFNWKGLSFSMQWVGALNVNRYMGSYYRYVYGATGANKEYGLLSYHYEGCWTPLNQENAVYPRPVSSMVGWNYANSTLWLRDASYLRLKNVTIGYTFTDASLKKAGISSLGITLSGYNLLTFSKLKELDPESNTASTSGYPLVKLYSLGVNINF